MTLKIVVIHPELLGTYGDTGNARVLAHRARVRGIAAEITSAPHDQLLPSDGDIYLLGGGEDRAQIASVESLRSSKRILESAHDGGAVLFAVCAGFQILGEEFPGADGELIAGLGLLPVKSKPGRGRLVGEVWLRSGLVPEAELTGFENHRGRTDLHGVEPFGHLQGGHQGQARSQVHQSGGNGGVDGRVDGAIAGNIVATYLHGPALVRNPGLADALLTKVLGVLVGLPSGEEIAELLAGERVDSARRNL